MTNLPTIVRPSRFSPKALAGEIHLDRSNGTPLHAQLRDGLAHIIATRFREGDQFFAERELVEALAVSRITVRRALDDLAREGHLLRAVGRGGTTVRTLPAEAHGSGLGGGRKDLPAARLTTIGIFAPDWDSESANAILGQFASACRKNNLEVKLHWQRQNEAVENVLAECDERPGEAAFVLNLGSDTNGRLHQVLSGRGYKTVSTDPMPQGYPGDVVATDARAAVRLGLDHLISLGHRRIVLLVNEPIRDKSVIDKIDEFLQVMSDRGLSVEARTVICGTQAWQNSYEAAYGHMADVWDLRAGEKPTAVFTVSDPGAWAALKWFRERGVSVPGEVSVMGFENAASSAHVTPTLTTLAHPTAEAAARCLDILRLPVSEPGRVQLIAPLLIVRDSTAAVAE
jgi:LacI family transcriptional regulator